MQNEWYRVTERLITWQSEFAWKAFKYMAFRLISFVAIEEVV